MSGMQITMAVTTDTILHTIIAYRYKMDTPYTYISTDIQIDTHTHHCDCNTVSKSIKIKNNFILKLGLHNPTLMFFNCCISSDVSHLFLIFFFFQIKTIYYLPLMLLITTYISILQFKINNGAMQKIMNDFMLALFYFHHIKTILVQK